MYFNTDIISHALCVDVMDNLSQCTYLVYHGSLWFIQSPMPLTGIFFCIEYMRVYFVISLLGVFSDSYLIFYINKISILIDIQ